MICGKGSSGQKRRWKKSYGTWSTRYYGHPRIVAHEATLDGLTPSFLGERIRA